MGALTSGCGSMAQVDPAAGEDSTSAPLGATRSEPDATRPQPDAKGALVASAKLPSGHTLEFYDFESAALVSESGEAYSNPEFNPTEPIEPGQLVDIWTRFSPDTPVPDALVKLQERLLTLPGPYEPPTKPDAQAGGSGSLNVNGLNGPLVGQVQPMSSSDCNNGCCNAEWLLTFRQCAGYGTYSWFLYNYFTSYANGTNIFQYDGLVCSASGTSSYTVAVSGGVGGTWLVPQATWRSYYWLAAYNMIWGWDTQAIYSVVNEPSSPHLHTYCGDFYHK